MATSPESCCQPAATQVWSAVPNCPSCDIKGSTVDPASVRGHLTAAALPRVTAPQYRFCRTPDCDVVYYGPAATDVLLRDDVATDVGCKQGSQSRLVCYCFTHSADDIAADVSDHDTSHIRTAIAESVARHECRCEQANPSGRCCLADVSAAIRGARKAPVPT